jgi:hypothetical protein
MEILQPYGSGIFKILFLVFGLFNVALDCFTINLTNRTYRTYRETIDDTSSSPFISGNTRNNCLAELHFNKPTN